jgi:hypothetical protein
MPALLSAVLLLSLLCPVGTARQAPKPERAPTPKYAGAPLRPGPWGWQHPEDPVGDYVLRVEESGAMFISSCSGVAIPVRIVLDGSGCFDVAGWYTWSANAYGETDIVPVRVAGCVTGDTLKVTITRNRTPDPPYHPSTGYPYPAALGSPFDDGPVTFNTLRYNVKVMPPCHRG